MGSLLLREENLASSFAPFTWAYSFTSSVVLAVAFVGRVNLVSSKSIKRKLKKQKKVLDLNIS